MGKENSGGTPGNGGGEDISDVGLQLFSHNKAGNSGGWEGKYEIDALGGCEFHAAYQRQPQHQQASAANAETGQNAQNRADQNGDHHRKRIPPQRIKRPRILCSHFTGILFLRKTAARPPNALPIRYGAASAQGIADPTDSRETAQIGSMTDREVGKRMESSE